MVEHKFLYIDRRTAEVTLSNGVSQKCFSTSSSVARAPDTAHSPAAAQPTAPPRSAATASRIPDVRPGDAGHRRVALSMTSMSKAQRNFMSEFPAF